MARHPDIEPLRDSLLVRFADAALKRGDLALAHVQAESIANADLRAAALGRWRTAERTARLRERAGRFALVATALLLLVILGGTLYYNDQFANRVRSESAARHKAERERATAEWNLAIATEQGAGTYDLVNFILRDLRSAMQEELSVDRGITVPVANEVSAAIAGRVASPVIEYFERIDDAQWPASLRLEGASRMFDVGAEFLNLARQQEAARLTSATLSLRRRLLPHDSPAVAEATVRLGMIYTSMGDVDRAEPLLRAALEASRSGPGADTGTAINALDYLSRVEEQRGNAQAAGAQIDEALRLAAEGPQAGTGTHARMLNNKAISLQGAGQYVEAEALYREAIAI